MAARELRNISGEARSLQGIDGVWCVVEPDAILVVPPTDERYYQTGETGEPAIWAEVTKADKAGNKGAK